MNQNKCRDVIEKFLTFAEEKGIALGGDVIYGFAMENNQYRPLHKDDYPILITDFIDEYSHNCGESCRKNNIVDKKIIQE